MVQYLLSLFRTKKRFKLNTYNRISPTNEKINNNNDLTTVSLTLKDQLQEAYIKISLLEDMMISQSRMAMMGEMIGMIAHQWRQPITIIGMITNNAIIDLQMGERNVTKLIEDLELVDKQVHYLSQTIDDFRNLFRPNKFPQQLTYHDLKMELITILGKNFETHHISLNFFGDFSIEISTYKNELLHVFLNILNNAKDAFIENEISSPTINISANLIDHTISFTIQDNAGGISFEVLDRIFEPYFTTKDEKTGTGLGLYMSSIIIEKVLGGSIKAMSHNEETVFNISIPNQHEKNHLYVY